MSQFLQGPRWPVSKINGLLGAEQGSEECWRVNKYLGSMLTFDFGAHVLQDRRGQTIELGSSRLGVRDCAWLIEGNGERLQSDDVDETTRDVLMAAFRGAAIIGCDRRKPWLTFSFSNGGRLHLDITNRYEADPDEFVASLALRGGAYFEMLSDGAWELVPLSDTALQSVKAA